VILILGTPNKNSIRKGKIWEVKLKKEVKSKRIRRFLVLIPLLAFVIVILYRLSPVRSERDKLSENTEEVGKALQSSGNTSPGVVDTCEDSNFDICLPTNWHKHSSEIKKILRESNVLDAEPMRDFLQRRKKQTVFSGSVFKVTLEGGIEAVFKTTSGGDMVRDRMEETAYDLSVYTNLAYIPPTVHRTLECDFDGNGRVGGKSGFLSLFVDTEFDLLGCTKEQFCAVLSKIDEEELLNYKIFNFVFGNWDVGPGNVLVARYGNGKEARYHIVAIDNEGIANLQKVRYGQVPFVRWLKCPGAGENIQNFPFEKMEASNESSRGMIASKYGQWPPQRRHNYVLFDGAYWIQFTDFIWGSESDITDLLYPERLPETAKEKLKSLTKENLIVLIAQSTNITDFMRARVDGFIERRDMLLEHFNINDLQQISQRG
jgi:hypothetical protein